MTYKQFISNILLSRGRFINTKTYKERHHIIPKCMGGTNNENNLIYLYAREHFIAHKLLCKEYPNNKKLIYAWWTMANCNKCCTPEEYEEARIAFSKANTGEGNTMYGRHASKETRRKMSISHKGKLVGKKHPMYGKHHTEESKAKMRMSKQQTPKELRALRSKLQDKNKRAVLAFDKSDVNKLIRFESLSQASRETGIDRSCIRKCCNQKRNTAGGYIWRYDKISNSNIKD